MFWIQRKMMLHGRRYLRYVASARFIWAVFYIPSILATICSPVQANDFKMRVGLIAPLSGGNCMSIGKDFELGFRLGLSNRRGDVYLYTEDNQGDPRLSAASVQKLIDSKVDLVIGPPCGASGGGILVRPLEEANMPFILTGQTLTKVQADNAIQLGSVEIGAVEDLAKSLNVFKSVRVDRNAPCWITHEAKDTDSNSISICPTSNVDKEKWQEVSNRLRQTERRELNMASALGFSAAEIVIQALNDLEKKDGKANLLKNREFSTLLGRFSSGNKRSLSPTPLMVIFPKDAPNANGADRARMDAEKKDCKKCKKSGDCPQGQSLLAKEKTKCCTKDSDCAQGLLTP